MTHTRWYAGRAVIHTAMGVGSAPGAPLPPPVSSRSPVLIFSHLILCPSLNLLVHTNVSIPDDVCFPRQPTPLLVLLSRAMWPAASTAPSRAYALIGLQAPRQILLRAGTSQARVQSAPLPPLYSEFPSPSIGHIYDSTSTLHVCSRFSPFSLLPHTRPLPLCFDLGRAMNFSTESYSSVSGATLFDQQ